MACTSCTEFAILSSGAGLAVSQNAYAKAYSGTDFLTIMRTEKDIKTACREAGTKIKNLEEQVESLTNPLVKMRKGGL